MNAEQKKRIAHEISNWKNACNCRAVQLTGDRMAALLQELVDAQEALPATNPSQISSSAELPAWENGDDPLIGGGLISRGVVDFAAVGIWPSKPAPEAEPVAYVTGYNNGYPTIAPINSALCMAIGTALYSAPPAPSVPDGLQTIPSHEQLTQILNGLDRCAAAGSKRELLRVWIRDWTAHKLSAAPTPAEAPADVARDAARYRACNGSNCGCTGGISHSDDCISEHDAIVDEAALVDHVEHGGWKCFGCGYDGQDNQRYNRICARCGVHR